MSATSSSGDLRGRSGRETSRAANQAPVATPAQAAVLDCAPYVAGVRLPGHWDYRQAIAEVRGRGEGFAWLGLHEPDAVEIEGVAETFGLHELAVEDAVHAHQRPKLEHYDETLFMVLRPVGYVAAEPPKTATEIVETGELMLFVGPDFIITVRHGEHSPLTHLRARLDADPERIRTGPAAVLLAIADHVVDHYLDVSERVAEDVDELEDQVFVPGSTVSADQIYFLKREILKLRRAVAPLATPLQRLAEGYSRVVPAEVRSYFRNVSDHLSTVSERIAHFDNLLTTLVDATTAMIALQQNTDMRKITSWAAIIAVPTALAGIYGMNFDHMPETHWYYGYPAVLGVMLVLCLTLYTIFRRKRWL